MSVKIMQVEKYKPNTLIRVHITVSQQSEEYFKYCIDNHKSLATNPDSIAFSSYCLDDVVESAYHKTDQVFELGQLRGSTGHAVALNAAFKNFQPRIVNIVADSDTVMLKHGWDVLVLDMLKQYDIIATCYEDIGGFSSGSGPSQTYKKLPTFSWAAISPNKDFSSLDMMPAKDAPELIDTEEKSRIYCLPVGYTLVKDVGWKAPKFIYENKIKCLTLIHTKPTAPNSKAVKSGEDYHEEYQLPDGEPLVAHQRGSMKHVFRISHLSKTFYDACEAYISNTKE